MGSGASRKQLDSNSDLECPVALNTDNPRTLSTNEDEYGFHKQMKLDVHQKMANTVAVCRDMLNSQEEKNKEFNAMIDGIESEIHERVEHLKNVLDLEEHRLLQDLEIRKRSVTEQMHIVTENIEQHMSLVVSLIKDAEELGKNGVARDIALQKSALQSRAAELTDLGWIQRQVDGLGSVRVTFDATNRPVDNDENPIGQVHWQGNSGIFSINIFHLHLVELYIRLYRLHARHLSTITGTRNGDEILQVKSSA
jgi:hypothetical protein